MSEASSAISVASDRMGPLVVAGQSLAAVAIPALSGVLLAACFPPLDWTMLSWVALAPLAGALSCKTGGPEVYLGAYIGGVVFYLGGMDFLRTSYSGTWLSGPWAIGWVVQGLVNASVWPATVACMRRLTRASNPPMAVVLPLVWVSFEFLRHPLWLLLIGTGFPWLQLGLTQAKNTAFAQIADLGGVYALGWLVASVNGFWIDLGQSLRHRRVTTRPRKHLRLSIAIVAVLATFTCLYGTWRLSQPLGENGPPLAIVSLATELRPEQKPLADQLRAVQPSPQLLVWSEGADNAGIVAPFVESASERDASAHVSRSTTSQGAEETAGFGGADVSHLEQRVAMLRTPIATGTTRLERHADSFRRFNSVAYLTPERGYQGCYDKVYLTPFAEYVPSYWLARLLFGRERFSADSAARFEPGTRYPTFELRSRTSDRPYYFAASVCYDVGFPELYRRFMRSPEGGHAPDFFLVSSSEGSDQTWRMQQMLLAMTRFRAIECRRAFCRCVDGGYSAIIDGNGRVLDSLRDGDPAEKRTILVGRVPLDKRFSFYVYAGDWLPIGCCVVTGVLLVWPRKRRLLSAVARPEPATTGWAIGGPGTAADGALTPS